MAKLRIISDGGEEEVRIVTRDVSFVEGQDTVLSDAERVFRPKVAQRIEYDDEGGMSSVTTVCGETENRRESDKKPRLTVEAIVTEDQLSEVKALQTYDDITLVSDVHNGPVEIRRVTIEQNTDLIEFKPNGEAWQLGFNVQIQLREP